MVNNKVVKNVVDLLKGDIINVLTSKKNFVFNNLKNTFFLHTFIEVDFYTNQIVIVKNLNELTKKDFLLLSRDLYNILELQKYLTK